jgi:hypothetical protein
MTLTEFYAELERHDWYYHFSDDHSVWCAGEAESAKMRSIAEQSPAHKELYDQFCAHRFSGESFGKPKAPAPVKPPEGT